MGQRAREEEKSPFKGFSFNQGQRRETWLCGKAAAWFGPIIWRQVYNSRGHHRGAAANTEIKGLPHLLRAEL